METNGQIFIFLFNAMLILGVGYLVSRNPDDFRAKIFAFLLIVVLLSGFTLSLISQKNLTAFAALYGALLAALGWVITNIQNRYQNRLQHSANLIHHFTQDPELEFHIVRIKQAYPDIKAIPPYEIEAMRLQSKDPRSYNVASRSEFTTPLFYSIVHLLNFFERIAFLYNNGSLDRIMIRHQLNPALAGFLTRFQNVVRMARQGETRKTAYSDLVSLCLEWYGLDLETEATLTQQEFQRGYMQRFAREYK